MRAVRYAVADVLTDTPLQGNQLAVFTDAREIPEELLQPLARGFRPALEDREPRWDVPRRCTHGSRGTADRLESVEVGGSVVKGLPPLVLSEENVEAFLGRGPRHGSRGGLAAAAGDDAVRRPHGRDSRRKAPL